MLLSSTGCSGLRLRQLDDGADTKLTQLGLHVLDVLHGFEAFLDQLDAMHVGHCAVVGQGVGVNTDDIEDVGDGGEEHTEHGGTPS